jgi:hypothetical protein
VPARRFLRADATVSARNKDVEPCSTHQTVTNPPSTGGNSKNVKGQRTPRGLYVFVACAGGCGRHAPTLSARWCQVRCGAVGVVARLSSYNRTQAMLGRVSGHIQLWRHYALADSVRGCGADPEHCLVPQRLIFVASLTGRAAPRDLEVNSKRRRVPDAAT